MPPKGREEVGMYVERLLEECADIAHASRWREPLEISLEPGGAAVWYAANSASVRWSVRMRYREKCHV